MLSSACGGGAPTVVLTSDDVLFSSFFSAIVLSGSTDAVLVMVLAVAGEVAWMVIDPFAPAFTSPPSHVTVIVVGSCGSAGSSSVQENRLVVEYDTSDRPGGNVSTTLTLVALAAPRLLTTSV